MSTEPIIRYTTAPVAYDYPTTVLASEPLPYQTRLGHQWRRVTLTATGAKYQMGRYGSGLHPSFNEDQWQWELGRGYDTKPIGGDA